MAIAPDHPSDLPPRSVGAILARYAAGDRDFAGTDLEGVQDFRGACLAGAIFDDCGLLEGDFRDADLRDASFRRGYLKLADFRGADLRGASFFEASLEAARFDGARYDGAEFLGAFCYSNQIKAGDAFP